MVFCENVSVRKQYIKDRHKKKPNKKQNAGVHFIIEMLAEIYVK